MLPFDDPTSLSLLFHLNSEPWLNDAAYRAGGDDEPAPGPAAGGSAVVLPPVTPTALDGLFRDRRSVRSFAPVDLSLADLAAVLHATYGVVEVDRSGPGPAVHRRSVPSAGGLYPLDVYVFLRRVQGVAAGLFRYEAETGSLLLLRDGDQFAALQAVLYTYPFVEEANAVLALVATFARAQAKYGPRGYRYILLEAGHAGQNACLRAAELGLSTLCMGGFIDSGLNRLLELDPRRAGVVYAIGIGRAAGDQPERDDEVVDPRGG